jgi:hypothetical protein
MRTLALASILALGVACKKPPSPGSPDASAVQITSAPIPTCVCSFTLPPAPTPTVNVTVVAPPSGGTATADGGSVSKATEPWSVATAVVAPTVAAPPVTVPSVPAPAPSPPAPAPSVTASRPPSFGGFTGFGAGPGYTGFGAGPGYTGTTAGDAGFTGIGAGGSQQPAPAE